MQKPSLLHAPSISIPILSAFVFPKQDKCDLLIMYETSKMFESLIMLLLEEFFKKSQV